jgi:hypothetical protein
MAAAAIGAAAIAGLFVFRSRSSDAVIIETPELADARGSETLI